MEGELVAALWQAGDGDSTALNGSAFDQRMEVTELPTLACNGGGESNPRRGVGAAVRCYPLAGLGPVGPLLILGGPQLRPTGVSRRGIGLVHRRCRCPPPTPGSSRASDAGVPGRTCSMKRCCRTPSRFGTMSPHSGQRQGLRSNSLVILNRGQRLLLWVKNLPSSLFDETRKSRPPGDGQTSTSPSGCLEGCLQAAIGSRAQIPLPETTGGAIRAEGLARVGDPSRFTLAVGRDH